MPADLNRLPKVGDPVRIISDQSGDPVGTETVIVQVPKQNRPDGKLSVRVEARVNQAGPLGTWGASNDCFEYLDDDLAPSPQPKLFDSHTEANVGTKVEHAGRIAPGYALVQANWTDVESTKAALAKNNYLIGIEINNSYQAFTLAEAKQVAVALFNQILWHETLLKDDTDD